MSTAHAPGPRRAGLHQQRPGNANFLTIDEHTTTRRRRGPHQSLVVLFAIVLCATAAAPAASPPLGVAAAAAAQRTGRHRSPHHTHARPHGRRVGGHVRGAWPKRGRAPHTRQTRWLARQVGATKPHPCAKRSGKGHRCHRARTVEKSADPATYNQTYAKLTGYCVQVDHGYGQLVVRQVQGDFELSTPLARANVPAGFSWYGLPHTVGVTVKGNAMNVTLDGAQVLDIPDLAAASTAAVKTSYNVTASIAPPTAGGYGLRTWSDGLVSLQQMTVLAAP